MPEAKVHSDVQKPTFSIFLVIGAVMLALGIYMGYAKANEAHIIVILIGSVGLFVVAVMLCLKLVKMLLFNKAAMSTAGSKAKHPPTAKVEVESKAIAEIKPGVSAEIPHEISPKIKPDTPVKVMPCTKVKIKPDVDVEIKPTVKASLKTSVKIDNRESVAIMMGTPLGELLLAGLIKYLQSD